MTRRFAAALEDKALPQAYNIAVFSVTQLAILAHLSKSWASQLHLEALASLQTQLLPSGTEKAGYAPQYNSRHARQAQHLRPPLTTLAEAHLVFASLLSFWARSERACQSDLRLHTASDLLTLGLSQQANLGPKFLFKLPLKLTLQSSQLQRWQPTKCAHVMALVFQIMTDGFCDSVISLTLTIWRCSPAGSLCEPQQGDALQHCSFLTVDKHHQHVAATLGVIY